MSSREGIHELEGEAIRAALRQGGVRSFPYDANKPGLWLMTGFAVFMLLFAGGLYWRTGLDGLWNQLTFLLLLAVAGWNLGKAIRWGAFSAQNYVALLPSALLLGRRSSALVIPLSELNARTMTLKQQTNNTSTLELKLAGLKRSVLLVNLHTHLRGMEHLLAELLPLMEPEHAEPGDATE